MLQLSVFPTFSGGMQRHPKTQYRPICYERLLSIDQVLSKEGYCHDWLKIELELVFLFVLFIYLDFISDFFILVNTINQH
ncbi:hypothetical protein ABC733_21985 [Mangrovibacter sp. SLW1]